MYIYKPCRSTNEIESGCMFWHYVRSIHGDKLIETTNEDSSAVSPELWDILKVELFYSDGD